MKSLRLVSPKSSITAFIHQDWLSLWDEGIVPKWIPLISGIILAELVAFLIVRGMWYIAFPLALLAPLAILLLRYPFASVMLWLLVAPFLQTTPTVPERTLYWMVHRAMPPAVLAMMILVSLIQPNKNYIRRLGRAELVLVPFVAIGILSILLLEPAPNIIPTLYLFYERLFVPICLYWIVRLTTPHEQDFKRLLPIMLVVVLLQSSIGMLGLFAPEATPPDWRPLGSERVVGTLRAPFLLYHAAMQRKSGLIHLVSLSTFALGCLMTFLSFSRGSWLGGLVAIAGLLIVYPRATIRMAIALSIIMLVLGAGLLSDQLDWAAERLAERRNAQARIVMYDTAAKMIASRPFFGWGYENFRRFRDEFKGRVNNFVVTEEKIGIHNTFLGIAAEMGLISLFLYIFPLLWWLWLTKKVLTRLPAKGFWSQRLLIILWLTILNQIVVNSFMDMTHFLYGMGIWWITLGLIGSMVSHYLRPEDIGVPSWIYRSPALLNSPKQRQV
jgi:O-antigen ligase